MRCHAGEKKLLALFKERFWTPQARVLASRVVKQCAGCQLGKDYGPRPPVQGSTGAVRPWQILAVDIVGPLPRCQGFEYLLTFNDCFTRFVIIVPIAQHTALTVARALVRHVIANFGLPEHVLSDRGREFTSAIWVALSQLLGYDLKHTSPYHPQANGICERSHRTINNILRASLQENSHLTWPDLVPII